MAGDSVNWIITNKEWVFGAVCTVAGGAFALFKWVFPRPNQKSDAAQNNVALTVGAGTSITAPVQNTATVAVAAGASINAPVIAGSNNVQNVTMHTAPVYIPIQQRRPSSPTANEIRQTESKIPPYQRKQFLRNYIGLKVQWPVRLAGIQEVDYLDLVTKTPRWLVQFRYGKEEWGAWIDFTTDDIEKFPMLKVAKTGWWAWIEGEIIDADHDFTLRVSHLEFERGTAEPNE